MYAHIVVAEKSENVMLRWKIRAEKMDNLRLYHIFITAACLQEWAEVFQICTF